MQFDSYIEKGYPAGGCGALQGAYWELCGADSRRPDIWDSRELRVLQGTRDAPGRLRLGKPAAVVSTLASVFVMKLFKMQRFYIKFLHGLTELNQQKLCKTQLL